MAQTDNERRRRQRMRSIAIAVALGAWVAIIYAATIVRFGSHPPAAAAIEQPKN